MNNTSKTSKTTAKTVNTGKNSTTAKKSGTTRVSGKGKKKSVKKKNDLGQVLKKIIIALVIIDALILIALAGIYVFNLFDFQEEEEFEEPVEFVDDTYINGDSDEALKTLTELRNSGSLSSVLKNWAETDYEDSSLMQDKNILNFLLVGFDEGGGNTDTMMLLSLDEKNQKIYLNSIMRDSYTYIRTSNGDRYAKLNAAYSNGGISYLINTIQMDYKIKIDYYVTVNFNTFIEIVNLIGGIDLDVQQYEAEEANISKWGENTHLSGWEALWFCRIRHCDADGDVSRTRRQRQFITAVIAKTKQVDVSQISDILQSLLKYVKTDCSTSKLISLSSRAILEKWYDFEIVSNTYPLSDNRMDYSGQSWVWIVDYPADAQAMQLEIYGKTNIELSEDRVSAIDIMRNGGAIY